MNQHFSYRPVSASTTLRDAFSRLETPRIEWLVLYDESDQIVGAIKTSTIVMALRKGRDDTAPVSSMCSGKTVVLDHASVSSEFAGVLAAPFADETVSCVVAGSGMNSVVAIVDRSDMNDRILLSVPHMGEKERDYMLDAFDSNWVAPLGPHVNSFEEEIAAYSGVRAAAALSSGTAALHLALVGEGVGRGDRVYCSDLTFAASVNAIMYVGADPVLIDAAPDSWNMSAAALKRALKEDERNGQLPKAAMVVNVYGQQADMDVLMPLLAAYEIPLIEDAAESLGARYRDRASGSFGKCAAFSFNGNKIITTSGGGMLVSDDEELIEKARFLSTQAREPVPYYLHQEVGFNYRMSNILSALGRGQLTVLDDRVAARRAIYYDYKNALAEVPGVYFMPELEHAFNTHWLSTVLFDGAHTRATADSTIDHLDKLGIEARHIWRPMHLQPIYSHARKVSHEPEAQMQSARHYARGICLPSATNMTSGQRARVIEALRVYLLTQAL